MLELLLVISIILILAAMLLPALGRSREKARITRWASGIRNMMVHDDLALLYDMEDQDLGAAIVANKAQGFSIENYHAANFDLDNVGIRPAFGRWQGKGATYHSGSGFLERTNLNGLPEMDRDFSVIAWVKFNSVSTVQNIITLSNGVDTGWQLGLRNRKITVWRKGGSILVQAEEDTYPDEWIQIGYTFGNSEHKLYINGEMIKSSHVAGDVGTISRINLGRWAGGIEYLQGRIDELMYFNDDIDAITIRDDYRNGRP